MRILLRRQMVLPPAKRHALPMPASRDHRLVSRIHLVGNEVRFENRSKLATTVLRRFYQDLALAYNLDVGVDVFLGREPGKADFRHTK
jgi:hypothetical protein